ncbi:putative signal transducing protein [Niabella soli]|uniref:DUF2007 domain-containing protein n=1 Tax=Niabella soli DSM 19437 TaxID=929713 RepID=W0F3H0_9BACT|nr:DUF2007 domain-containing protein [Niabella soli]AHF17572.1 hypothetical protein NIASO_10145 [Niabella soli DSM 19437]
MTHFNQEGTVVVKTYNNMAEALAAKELLEENGIQAIVEDLDVMGLSPLAGIKIKVFSGDEEQARQLLQPS